MNFRTVYASTPVLIEWTLRKRYHLYVYPYQSRCKQSYHRYLRGAVKRAMQYDDISVADKIRLQAFCEKRKAEREP